MENIFNKEIHDKWERPWDVKTFDDLYNRDERYFSILIKGLISWLNRNIILYGEPINHFIFNTGSSIMYVETNGYEYSINETTGEDQMYMHLPRCTIELGNISIDTAELTNPYSRGYYERKTKNTIAGFNADIRRMPITLSITLHYSLTNFNEMIILMQELIDKIIFQKYFNITYLGQIIQCSIEYANDIPIQLNNIDMASTETKNRHLDININVESNYPIIDERSEVPSNLIISSFVHETQPDNDNPENKQY